MNSLAFKLPILLMILSGWAWTKADDFKPEASDASPLSIWPLPTSVKHGSSAFIISRACSFNFLLNFSYAHEFYQETLREYKERIFKNAECSQDALLLNLGRRTDGRNELIINIENPDIEIILNSHIPDLDESYALSLDPVSGFELRAKNYLGFLHGLETFSQLVKHKRRPNANGLFYITHLPIFIEDSPAFPYRAIMLDSSRHFLSVELIKKNIRAAAFNKLNVLHWHIVDSDSFPLFMPEHPNITKYGAFSMENIYFEEDVIGINLYAKRYGVQIVPEFDNPGHTRSWGLSPEFSDGVSCVNKTIGSWLLNGQLSPSKNSSYQLLGKVLKQAFSFFKNPVFHLGGDEVSLKCYENETLNVTVGQYME